jgi:hypothetical protein
MTALRSSVTTVVVVLVGAACIAGAQSPQTVLQMQPTSPVQVVLELRPVSTPKQIHHPGTQLHVVVTMPHKDHVFRADPGQKIEWHFTNNSDKSLKMSVGHFRTPARYAQERDKRAIPLEFPKGSSVDVPAHGKGILEAKVRDRTALLWPADAEASLTYAYDIIDADRLVVLLDPEIEIPK